MRSCGRDPGPPAATARCTRGPEAPPPERIAGASVRVRALDERLAGLDAPADPLHQLPGPRVRRREVIELDRRDRPIARRRALLGRDRGDALAVDHEALRIERARAEI